MSRHVTVLVVSPAFHGYLDAIGAAVGRLGFDVVTCAYDRPRQPGEILPHIGLKARRVMGLDTERHRDRQLDARAARCVASTRPDAVVVIRGDHLGEQFWSALDAHRIPRITWLYDNLNRMAHDPADLSTRSPIASHSHEDVKALSELGADVRYLPNGFDPSVDFSPVLRDEVVLVGERYPNREVLLHALGRHGIQVRAYGGTWSRHPLDWRPRRQASHSLPWGRQVSRARSYGLMAGAPAALNIHGPLSEFRDGLSIRTFEAAGVGAVQLIDRPEVAEFYEPDTEVAVFEGADQLVDLVHRAVTDVSWSARLRERARARTLAEHTYDARVPVLVEGWATHG